ncbi:MAG TPA: hypothetical protein VG796_23325 [Verrucomicrobiales bacterium]|nr:hypothetical protein [Verrucomicrobiales bacterium]
MSCPGKIARLPRVLREELNRRLERNVPARLLVEWLNALPEVQEILTNFFNSNPINEQNICNWRRSGFAEWQTRQDFLEHLREFTADAAEIDAAAPSMADHAANLLSIHFAVTLRELSLPPRPTPTPTPPPSEPACSTIHDSTIHDSPLSSSSHSSTIHSPLSKLKPLFAISRAVASLRRGNQTAARKPSSPPHRQIKPNQAISTLRSPLLIPPLPNQIIPQFSTRSSPPFRCGTNSRSEQANS